MSYSNSKNITKFSIINKGGGIYMNNEASRKVYIDFLKIIAIYMVIFNHTGIDGFALYTVSQGSYFFPLYLFNAIFIKIAVPLFFMTSGALLLNKQETFKTIFFKRFLKYLLILIIGSLIAYCYTSRNELEIMTVSYFIKTLYSNRLTTAYWYLYAYLSYILMLPFIRRLAKAMTDHEYFIMTMLYSAMKLLPIIEFLIWKGEISHNTYFSFFITIDYVFYPLMGYFIEQRLSVNSFSKIKLFSLIALSICTIIACCLITQYKCSLFNDWSESSSQTFFNSLIFIPSFTVFYTVKIWFTKHPPSIMLSQIINHVGGTVFGIYLFEQIYRNETKDVFYFLKPYIGTLLSCWIWILSACLIGIIVTSILQKIPGINRFL